MTINGDTVICFTVKQSKFLLKTYYKAEELKQLDSLNREIIAGKDSIINLLELNCKDYKQVTVNNLDIINQLKKDNKYLQKKINKQKILNKLIGITGAIALIVALIR